MRKYKTKLPIKLISFVLLLTALLFGALSYTTSAKNSRYSGSIDDSTVIAGRLYAGFCVQPTLDEIHQTYNYKPLISVSSSHGITFRTLGGNGYDIDGKTILDGIEEACRTYYGSKYATQGTFFATKVNGVTEGVETCAVIRKSDGECAWKDSWNWGGTSGKQRWRTFTISTDIAVDEKETSTQFWVMGMIHYDRSYNGLSDWVYAKKIGFCRKSADCDAASAEGKNADGLVNSAPSGGWVLQRMSGSVNPPYRIYSSWTYPNRNYHLTMTMNNKKLIDGIIDGSIAVNSETFRNKIKNGEDATGTAYLYTHRCMNASFNQNGACGVGRLDLTVSIKRDKPTKTTFDGSVTASVGSCKDSECEVSTAKSTVSFAYQMKRNNDGPDKDATNNWTAYYNSNLNGGISSTASKTGSVTYSKNKGLTALSNSPQTVEVTLNPGDSAKVCQKLTFRKEVVFDASHPNGTVNTSSDLIERSDCMTVKRRNNVHTFNGKTTHEVEGLSPTTEGGKRYNTDAATAKVTFNYSFCRTDEVEPNPATGYWYTYHNNTAVTKDTTATQSGTNSFDKKGCVKKDSPDVREVTLKVGDNKICGAIGWLKSVDEKGTKGDWDHSQECVTIHKYAWYDVVGKVTVSTDATKNGKIYWTDINTANIQFFHKTSTTTTVAIKPKYKTSKSPDPGATFNIQKDYKQGTAINKDSGEYTQYKSPSDGKASVDVAKDTGTEYCQTMTYYTKVREDSGDYKTATDAKGCITLKRYKTTFSGSTTVYVGSDFDHNMDNDEYTVDSSKYTQYPATVKVTFKHTVKRNNDTNGSPNPKKSTIATSIDGTTGYRGNDPHGTARTGTEAQIQTGDLEPDDDETHTDSFTVRIYPEQEITLCQQMTYRNEIQGTDYKTTKGNKACVKIKMGKATCLGKEFGVNDAKNYMRVDIYKNSKDTVDVSSDVRYEGNTVITSWAKPSDQIRFNYDACAGGELARQYSTTSGSTTYDITANAEGNLYGKTLSSSPYTATAKNIGKSSTTVGKGPFSDVYTKSVTSPSGSNIYTCDFYGESISDFYRIPAYIKGLTNESMRDDCNSDDLGSVPTENDLGKTIQQTASWTDIQYVNRSPRDGHNGTTAKITANVKIPYNYTLDVDTVGDGGYLIPGNDHTEKVRLVVEPRENPLVNGHDKYSTYTKVTKFRLIEIIVGTDRSDSAESFNKIVNDDDLFYDANGNIDLGNTSNGLHICRSKGNQPNINGGYDCNVISDTGEDKRYKQSENATGEIIGQYKSSIPYNMEPGVKVCYIAAVWPSDSHNNPKLVPSTDADENPALSEKGSYWKVSGATCYTVAKRPSFSVLGGDTYAQGYITARVQKFADNNGNNARIYGSWGEYAAIAGKNIKGFASGATLWGGSSIVSDVGSTKIDCVYSAYTFANSNCASNSSTDEKKLGNMKIDTTTSSNPETIAAQMVTRYTRTDSTGIYPKPNSALSMGTGPLLVEDAGVCKYENGTYVADHSGNSTFACIGDTGAKYTHVTNTPSRPAYIPKKDYCMGKGDTNNNRTSIIHVDNTLVIGGNFYYGRTTGYGCAEDDYTSISEIPQSILIAKKIIINEDVTHLDTWLIADEIITCNPGNSWRTDVPITDVNTKNCNKQLTINGPVMTKNLKLYRTYGSSYTTYYSNGTATGSIKASPAEIFTMGPEVYLWSFNQAQRYSQATTTYARELAPRY